MDELRNKKAPFISKEDNVQSMMRNVLLAIIPALLWGFYVFGARIISVIVMSLAGSVITETVYNKIIKRKNTVSDLSCIVTGLFIALSMPVSIPLYVPFFASVFAILVVKQLFGGLGKNFLNPALAGFVFAFVSFRREMTLFTPLFEKLPVFSAVPQDITDKAGALSYEKMLDSALIKDMFAGKTAGFIGEVSAVFILIGFLYLLVTKTVSFHITTAFAGTVFLISFIFAQGAEPLEEALKSILSGGVLFVAVFCAQDPVTSPSTRRGKLLFGIVCGIFTVILRTLCDYHTAPYFAVLFAELFSDVFDKIFTPVPYGRKRGAK